MENTQVELLLSTQSSFEIRETEEDYALGIHRAWEKTVFTIFIVITGVWIVLSNTVLIISIIKYRRLSEAYKLFRLTLAALDIIIAFCCTITMPMILIQEYDFNLIMCNILSFVSISGFFSVMYITSLMSVERFIYIAYATQHSRIMSYYKVVGYITCSLIIPALVTGYNRIFYDSVIMKAEMLCSTVGNAFGIIITIFIPSASMTVVIICSMLKLRCNRIHPSGTTKYIKGTVRMVFLISGIRWITYIPAFTARVIIVKTYTSDRNISRNETVAFFILRIQILLLSLISSSLNPIITFYIEKDLRIAAMKLMGRNVDYSWQRRIKVALTQSEKPDLM